MKFFNRFIIPLIGWILIVLTAASMTCIALYKFEVIDINMINSTVEKIFTNNDILIGSFIASFILFLISIRMAMGEEKPKVEREPIMLNGEHGQVAIALETFESVVSLVLKEIAKINEYTVLAKKKNEDVEILVRVAISPDANIAELVKSIQVQGIEEIEKVTGVTVKGIHVKISDITAPKHTSLKLTKPKEVKEDKKEEPKIEEDNK